MLRICKALFSTAAAAVLLAGGAARYYRCTLPDSYYVAKGQQLSLSTLLPVEAEHPAALAAAAPRTVPGAESVSLRLFGLIPIKNVEVTEADPPLVVPGGMPFGIKLLMDGVMVVGMGQVEGESPAKAAGIQVGDLLLSVNSTPVSGNTALRTAIADSDGAPCAVTLRRDGAEQTVTLNPVYSPAEQVYQAGIWVRDSTAGIGTVTYYEAGTGSFAGLGHPVCDVDTGEMIPLSSGEVAPVTIGSVKRGEVGAAGELRGYFTSRASTGSLTRNNQCGIFGCMEDRADPALGVPLGRKQEVRKGAATVLTTIDGTAPQSYTLEIEEIDLDNTGTRDMVVRITDEALLSATGGIVQGMSGSPILQNGKLVGAVTHVLVNDPTRGYAIFAERMYAAGQ